MINRKKILLGNKDIKERVLKDIFLNIQLSRDSKEILPDKYVNSFDLLKQYKKERNECRNFRIYGIIESPFVDCNDLDLFVFDRVPEGESIGIWSSGYVQTVKTTRLVSQDWECKNIFNKKKGKYLIELDEYLDSDYVYIFIPGVNTTYQNLFEKQLVFKYNTFNLMAQSIESLIPYGSSEAFLDIDGNIIEVDNDFDFFYNKHWINNKIVINKIRQKEWVPEESSAYCEEVDPADLNIDVIEL